MDFYVKFFFFFFKFFKNILLPDICHLVRGSRSSFSALGGSAEATQAAQERFKTVREKNEAFSRKDTKTRCNKGVLQVANELVS